jgi:hypothetical protein
MDPKLLAQITRLLTDMANTADEEATKTDDDTKKGVAVGLGLAVAVLVSVQDEVIEVEG